MVRKLLACGLILILLTMVVGRIGGVEAATVPKFQVNGVEFLSPAGEPAPYINKDDRTMVPIRFMAEALGVPNDEEHILWNGETRTALIIHEGTTVEIPVGKREIVVNGGIVTMDTAAEITQARTFIPARFIAEALGATVVWDGDHYMVHLLQMADPSFLDREDLLDHTNAGFYRVKQPGEFEFLINGDLGEWRALDTMMNPNLGKQVYGATMALLDDEYFVRTSYANDDNPRVLIKYAMNNKFIITGSELFSFVFYEETAFNNKKSWAWEAREDFSEKAFMNFKLSSLWDLYPPESGWSTPYFENKLRSAFVGMFGEETGIKVYNYTFDKYIDKRTKGKKAYESIKEVKIIDNLQIDFGNDAGTNLYFTFSYVE